MHSKPDQKKSGSKQKKRKTENPRRAQSFNEPSCFARTHSHDVGTRTEKTSPKTAALRCRANQTERKQQLAKLASKEAGDDSRQKRSKAKTNSEKTFG